jgi:RNA polymerase sigma-70 factor (ECF subfamily)
MQDDIEVADTSDEALMECYAQGQVSAFNTLYSRHEKSMWRYIYHSVQQHATADELMQDVWFAIARAASTYEAQRNGAKFKTWAYTLAHYRVVDHWRKAHSSAKHVSIDLDDDDDATQAKAQLFADSGFGPLRHIESHEQAKALIAAVESLPTEQREAFLLQAEGDMSVEDIAITMNVSFETAKSRLRYARSKLKTLLAEFAEVSL